MLATEATLDELQAPAPSADFYAPEHIDALLDFDDGLSPARGLALALALGLASLTAIGGGLWLAL